MNTTIKDVAKKAGVSLSTVSLVINQKKNISEKTVKKVKKAIEELNYHPQRSARGLASKKSGNIGFILTSDHFSRAEPFYTKIFLGSEFEARNHNYYILLTTVEKKFNKKQVPRFLLEKNVDSPILAGTVPNGLIGYLRIVKLPHIFIDYLPQKGKISAILIDNIDGANQVVTHLIEKGHRNIAFIAGEITHPSMEERLSGYKQALKIAGIPVNEQLIITNESNTGENDGFNMMSNLYTKNQNFTAVFAANDAMAFGCMRYLKERNLKIPDDIALAGFDDVDLALKKEPALTTVRVNKEDMGALAIKNLAEMISEEKKSIGKILVPVDLIVRNST